MSSLEPEDEDHNEVIPLGSWVWVEPTTGEPFACQVIGVDRSWPSWLYELGYIKQRPWPLRWWPKTGRLHHAIRAAHLTVIQPRP